MTELDGAARSTPLPCVRLGFALWYLPADQALTLLRLALEAAELLLVADFKLAERNLELPATLAARCLWRWQRATKQKGQLPQILCKGAALRGSCINAKLWCTSAAPYLPGLRLCCICNIPRVTALGMVKRLCTLCAQRVSPLASS